MNSIDSFASWLKAKRRETKMTQAELASATGLDRTYVTQIENGRVRLPQWSTRQKFHDVFGSDDTELVDLQILGYTSTGEEIVPTPISEMPMESVDLPALRDFQIEGLSRVTGNAYGVLAAALVYGFRSMNPTQRRDVLKLLTEIDARLNIDEVPDF